MSNMNVFGAKATLTVDGTVLADRWDQLDSFDLVASSLPEVAYSVNPEWRERVVATVLTAAGEAVFTYVRSFDFNKIGEALPAESSEATPTNCRLVLSVHLDGEDWVVYDRIFVAWRDAESGGIGFAHPVPGTGMTAEEALASEMFRQIHPTMERMNDIWLGLSPQAQRASLSGSMAHNMLAASITADDYSTGAQTHKGLALPDDPIIGKDNPAWQGALDHIPTVDVSSEAETGLSDIEKFLAESAGE